jgi:hypothetical protein
VGWLGSEKTQAGQKAHNSFAVFGTTAADAPRKTSRSSQTSTRHEKKPRALSSYSLDLITTSFCISSSRRRDPGVQQQKVQDAGQQQHSPPTSLLQSLAFWRLGRAGRGCPLPPADNWHRVGAASRSSKQTYVRCFWKCRCCAVCSRRFVKDVADLSTCSSHKQAAMDSGEVQLARTKPAAAHEPAPVQCQKQQQHPRGSTETWGAFGGLPLKHCIASTAVCAGQTPTGHLPVCCTSLASPWLST